MNLISHFPEQFTPSTGQKAVIEEIDKAFNSGYKFVICCAPTGSGKSLISKTLGNASSECSATFREAVESYSIFKRDKYGQYDEDIENVSGGFVLTITKSLQDQYKDLFPDLDILKGQSNYQCSYDENYTVSTAPCLFLPNLKSQCWSRNSCPYYSQRNRVLTSKFAALNYNMFFALPSHVKEKDFIICDEASELEDQLVKEFTCNLNFRTLKRLGVVIPPLPTSPNYSTHERWLCKILDHLEQQMNDIKVLLNKKTSQQKPEVRNNLSVLMTIRGSVRTLIETWRDSEYIFERNPEGVTFTPLKVDRLSSHIFNFGKKILLMSATIIDPKAFAKTLGIKKFKYVESPSSFDPKKAPIYITSKVKLNHNNLKTNLPKIVDTIKKICDYHKGDKGIIHTQTNTITSYIQKNLNNQRVIYREVGVTNEELLSQHSQSTNPTVIASPSMLFGVDLKDELARFQVIIKAPYLPLTDKRIKEMIKLSPEWYTNKMLSSLIQGCGRGIRSKKDHCVTYILDGGIAEAVINNKHKLPKYFVERFM